MQDRLEIEEIRVRGYRAIEDARVKLGALNVLIGPNGSGKSSFLDVLSFLSEAVGPREALGHALSKRGGLGRLLTLGRRDALEIELATRSTAGATSGGLRYELVIGASGIGHSIVRESLSEERSKRHHRLFDRKGVSAEASNRASVKLVRQDVLFLSTRSSNGAGRLRSTLETLHSYEAIDVSRSAPVRRPQTLEPTSLVVSPGGENLFSVLYQMRQEQPEWFERLVDALRAAFPGFERLDFQVVAGGQVILAWHHTAFAGKPFFANELSAGTLRFLHLAALLLSPQIPALVLIDEPEDSLHPELIRILTELLHEASERAQIIVATQSPTLLRWLSPADIIVANMDNGVCMLTAGRDLDLDAWIEEYSLDRLWQMGQLGGRP